MQKDLIRFIHHWEETFIVPDFTRNLRLDMHFEQLLFLRDFFPVSFYLVPFAGSHKVFQHLVGYNKFVKKMIKSFLEEFVLVGLSIAKCIFLNGGRSIQFVQIMTR